MAIKFTNNASSTLATSISASDTALTLTSGGGALFPSLGAGDYFYATLADSSNNLEIIKCTARSGNNLTVVRGQDGTTGRAYIAGDKIELRPVAADFTDMVTETALKLNRAGDTMTGPLLLPDGSVSAVALGNDGDANTGLFFPAADTVAVVTNGVERARWSDTGNYGLGSDNPANKLYVVDTSKTSSTGYANVIASFRANATNADASIQLSDNVTNSIQIALKGGTSGGIGFASNGTERAIISSTGDFTATGNVTAYSDARLKSDIETINDALGLVSRMRGVTFTKDGVQGVGVIAQEMQQVLPQVVRDEDEYMSVAYGNIVGVLIEAVKELSEKVRELEAR